MSTITANFLQQGDIDPIRGKLQFMNPNQVLIKEPYRRWIVATRTGAMTNQGHLIFTSDRCEFYINPADWRRLTGEGFEVAA